jgi:DNA-directed RNA polymerase specialized sigma24 family protein
MSLNKEVAKYYDNWLKFSRSIASDKVKGDDLLHTVLASILENPKIQGIVERGELDHYVRRSIHLSFHSSSSKFHYQYRKDKHVELTGDVPDSEDSTWIGARLDNETIDCVVRRLHPLDQNIFDLYCQPDFDYRSVSVATGIPYDYLRSRVHLIVKKLRKYVHRTPESPDRTIVHLP